jgi:hypothetical protein
MFERIILKISFRNGMGENVDWIHLAQGMLLWLPTVDTATNPKLHNFNCIIFSRC